MHSVILVNRHWLSVSLAGMSFKNMKTVLEKDVPGSGGNPGFANLTLNIFFHRT